MAAGHSVIFELSVCSQDSIHFFLGRKIFSEVEYDFVVIAIQAIFGEI